MPHAGIASLRPPVIAALGNFDGVHRGHQSLLSRLREKREMLRGGTILLVSFYPHPVEVLKPGVGTVRILTPLRQKIELLAGQGVDAFALLHFTRELAGISADDFTERVLLKTLKTDYLYLGPDARVGARRQGTPEYLATLFEQAGKQVVVVPFLSEGGEKISSGVIRRLVEEGDVSRAAALLGHPYVLDGLVVHGDHRGSTIGVPTANLAPSVQVLPALGVYASWAELRGARYPAVTNVGVRPTFGGSVVVVETHLMGYRESDFYGERLKVILVSRLRSEMKFQGVRQLVAQIHSDMENARCVLEKGA